MARVTVAIPVLNGARYLDEVLTAVRGQKLDRELEIVIVDSGSTDDSVEIAKRHGAIVHGIEQEDFSHGGTRNLLMQLSSGDHVAFITQDATPASPRWLASLLEGFEQADDVAAVFGPHDPRPDASHTIKSEMQRHFAVWGDGGTSIDVQRLHRTPAGIAEYRAFPGKLTFLSDVNCCLARWAWERVPYREVPYAEDQLLGRELIEAGFAKVFHPDARVLHSHDYPPGQFFKRYFDEFRSLREVLGHVQPWGPKTTLWDVRGLVGADKRWLEEQGVEGRDLITPLAHSARHWTIRMAGAIVGTRADRVPERLRGKLSLEGRASFVEHEVPESTLLDEDVAFDPDWPWEFVRREYPQQPIRVEPRPPRIAGPLTINWVVPPWKVGSGGITTIFRLIQQLERRGHSCAIYVFDPFGWDGRPGHELREEISGAVHPDRGTSLRGAGRLHPLRRLLRDAVVDGVAGPRPAGVRREGLPRAGRRASVLRHRSRVDLRGGDLPDGLPLHRLHAVDGRDPHRALRPRKPLLRVRHRPRRVPLRRRGAARARADRGLCAARDRAPRRRPRACRADGAVRTPARRSASSCSGRTSTRACRSRARTGVSGSPHELAALYRRASAGIVFSLTTHSLVAQEMMASGLPLVELNGPNVTSELGEPRERAELVDPRPDAVADALERILDDREAAAAMARRARGFVEERTWERAGDQIEAALRDFTAHPQAPVAG